MLIHKGIIVTLVLCFIFVEGGEEENEGGCSNKKIKDRVKIAKALNLVIENKMKELQKLEEKRIKMTQHLRKLCSLKKLASKPVSNEIYINFYRDNKFFERVLVSFEDPQTIQTKLKQPIAKLEQSSGEPAFNFEPNNKEDGTTITIENKYEKSESTIRPLTVEILDRGSESTIDPLNVVNMKGKSKLSIEPSSVKNTEGNLKLLIKPSKSSKMTIGSSGIENEKGNSKLSIGPSGIENKEGGSKLSLRPITTKNTDINFGLLITPSGIESTEGNSKLSIGPSGIKNAEDSRLSMQPTSTEITERSSKISMRPLKSENTERSRSQITPSLSLVKDPLMENFNGDLSNLLSPQNGMKASKKEGYKNSKFPSKDNFAKVPKKELTYSNCPFGQTYDKKKERCINDQNKNGQFKNKNMKTEKDENDNRQSISDYRNSEAFKEKYGSKDFSTKDSDAFENKFQEKTTKKTFELKNDASTASNQNLNLQLQKIEEKIKDLMLQMKNNQKMSSEKFNKGLKMKIEADGKQMNIFDNERSLMQGMISGKTSQENSTKKNEDIDETGILKDTDAEGKPSKTNKDSSKSIGNKKPIKNEKEEPKKAKPCKPSKEEIRLVIEGLKKRLLESKSNSTKDTKFGLNQETIANEFANVKTLLQQKIPFSKANRTTKLPFNPLDMNKLIKNFPNKKKSIEQKFSQEIKIQEEQTTKSSNDIKKSGMRQSQTEESFTNSDGSLKITIPQIEIASSSSQTKKPADSGSKDSMEEVMEKLFKKYPELKKKFKKEKTSQVMKPSKLEIRATLPNGDVVKVGEKHLTDLSMINTNGSLTLDKLGINVKNFNLSRGTTESPKIVEESSTKALEIENETKRIKPAKFKHNSPLKEMSRRLEDEKTTTTKQETTTVKIGTTTGTPKPAINSTTGTKAPKLISNLFKPVKEFKKMVDSSTKKVTKWLALSDQDHSKRLSEIPASNKEDIEKILQVKPPVLEFKSVLGKTLDAPGIFGKFLDEHEGTMNKTEKSTTAQPSKTTQVTTSKLPLPSIKS